MEDVSVSQSIHLSAFVLRNIVCSLFSCFHQSPQKLPTGPTRITSNAPVNHNPRSYPGFLLASSLGQIGSTKLSSGIGWAMQDWAGPGG